MHHETREREKKKHFFLSITILVRLIFIDILYATHFTFCSCTCILFTRGNVLCIFPFQSKKYADEYQAVEDLYRKKECDFSFFSLLPRDEYEKILIDQ